MVDSQSLPLVSVVMATYNGVAYLPKQIDSILSQTYSPIELVVTDDCSTDGTWELLVQYAAQDARVRVFRNPENLGYVRNFEKAMLLAQGEWIAPSDQDDIWLPHKLAVLQANIGKDTILYANSQLINDQDKPTGQYLSDVKKLTTYNNCLNYTIGNSAPGHGMLFPASLVKDCVPFPVVIPHDYWLGFVACFRSQVRYWPEVLVLYRQHNQNVFGASKVASADGTLPQRRKKSAAAERAAAQARIQLLYEKCPADLVEEK
ncbi:MAG: glycosyltransferase family 2 protein, partial [Sphingobacteriia bacterium]